MKTEYFYCPIHLRSHYSLLRGCLSPEEICRYAAEKNYPAVGMADVNNFYGIVRFIREAQRWGIKPLCGAAVYSNGEHLFTAYCRNLKGFTRANQIISRLFAVQSFRNYNKYHCETYNPVLDLAQNGWEGLTLVSYKAEVLSALGQGRRNYLYAGLVYGLPFRQFANWAAGQGFPLIAVNHGVYRSMQDRKLYSVLRAIDENVTVERLPAKEYIQPWHRIVSADEMERFFSALPESLENACRLILESDCSGIIRKSFIFPSFRGLSEKEAFQYLRRLCLSGVERRYSKAGEDVRERLNYELAVIKAKGFAGYFLVVHDIVSRRPRTCGRGSSAASIVSYLLGITHVDPLKHNLFFERFLNMGRKDPPDIDVDFPWDERENALKYVFETYPGKSGMVADHVTFGPRSALRDPAKAMGMTEEEIAKIIVFRKHGDLEKIPSYLLRAYQRLRGMPRHIGMHPGGVVITPMTINNYTHVQISPQGLPVIAWEKDGTEDAGLVKIDILGNRSLAVLRDTLEEVNPIRKQKGEGPITWETFNPLKDEKTRDLIESGDTLGVFYVESPATRQLLKKMGRGDYEHLIIASSIIRPAANRFIKEFIRRLRGSAYSPLHPLIAETLKETYGIMVYQEDVARVAIAAAGFTTAEADGLRKTLAKKNRAPRLAMYRHRFYEGAVKRGIGKNIADQLWEMVLSFDGYSFCKPHSASYALVSYRLAWLKKNYPLHFFVSVINNGGGFYARQVYLNAVRRLGAQIFGPDVNESEYDYTVISGAVRTGLRQLKDISEAFCGKVLEDRKIHGRFLNFFNFVRRLAPEFIQIRILIRSGSLDSLSSGFTRPQLFWIFIHMEREPVLFEDPQVPEFIGDYSRGVKMLDEVKTLGLLVSCHPLDLFLPRNKNREEINLPLCIDSRSIGECRGIRICITGFLVAGKEVHTRTRRYMSFVSFDDAFSVFETVLFPDTYERLLPVLEENVVFMVIGKVQEEYGVFTVEVEDLLPLKGGLLAFKNLEAVKKP